VQLKLNCNLGLGEFFFFFLLSVLIVNSSRGGACTVVDALAVIDEPVQREAEITWQIGCGF